MDSRLGGMTVERIGDALKTCGILLPEDAHSPLLLPVVTV